MIGSSTRVSVPGKLILMGEHAAVYGQPAIVAAFGVRLRARLDRVDGGAGVTVDVPALRYAAQRDWPDIVAYTQSARTRWLRYADKPSPEAFAALSDEEPGRLAWIALGETVAALVQRDGARLTDLPGLRLRVESDLPIGAGFGSSAAAALAIVSACAATLDDVVDWALISAAAQEVERRQHGSPSGVDAATVLHGGVLRTWRDDAGELQHEAVPARSEMLGAFRVFDTGAPVESTGSVVAGVRALHDRDPAAFAKILREMGREVERVSDALVQPRSRAADLIGPVGVAHRCLVRLGVVPEPVEQMIARIEAAGGAGKISGAGSLSGPGAGSLLVVHPEPGEIDKMGFLGHLMSYPVALGVEGVRVESVA